MTDDVVFTITTNADPRNAIQITTDDNRDCCLVFKMTYCNVPMMEVHLTRHETETMIAVSRIGIKSHEKLIRELKGTGSEKK
jgi:hypothetical protein